MPDATAVNSMFGRIARRYDLANRVLSAGIDTHWRARLVAAVADSGAREILDMATGSGDVAFALARGLPSGARVVGMDFCAPMLEVAQAKRSARAGAAASVEFRAGDGLAIPAPQCSFDSVTIAFGLRNMADRAACLAEMRRVLRPGGSLFILEFSQPWPWVRPFYSFYLRRFVPGVAGLITGEPDAYKYLGDTIGAFPGRDALSAEILSAGFSRVRARGMTAGIVALHAAQR
jgi:demethylmenaquinone methyltransferase/2-methoxy-6-polyprenyl-1,4-benzoquinol methylase